MFFIYVLDTFQCKKSCLVKVVKHNIALFNFDNVRFELRNQICNAEHFSKVCAKASEEKCYTGNNGYINFIKKTLTKSHLTSEKLSKTTKINVIFI